MGLKPIVVINKVDRPDARPHEVVNEVFDLFASLDASDEQLDFPILYGSAKEGWMAVSPEGLKEARMQPLFDLVLSFAPSRRRMWRKDRSACSAPSSRPIPYLGRVVTGRITSGTVAPNQSVKVLDHDGKLVEQGRVQGARLPRA